MEIEKLGIFKIFLLLLNQRVLLFDLLRDVVLEDEGTRLLDGEREAVQSRTGDESSIGHGGT